MRIGRNGASRNKSATFWPIPESHLDTNLTPSLVRDETLDPQDLYEDDQPMIDKPVAATGTMPGTFSPLVRAVIDSVTEGIVLFDQQGRLLYANPPRGAPSMDRTATCATACRASARGSPRSRTAPRVSAKQQSFPRPVPSL